MSNKLRFFDHVSGAAIGMFFFSLAAFDNELHINLVYLSALIMCCVMGFGVLTGDVRRFRVQPPVYAYLFLILWALVTILWADDFNLAFRKILTMMQIAVAMFVITHMIFSNLTLRYILILLFLAVLLNYFVYKGFYTPGKPIYIGDRFVGMLGNANELSRIVMLYLIIAMYLVVIDRNKLVRLVAAAGLFAGATIILATQSRTGLVLTGLIAFGSFFLMKGVGQKLIAVVLTFIVVTYGVIATDVGEQLVDKVGQRFEGMVGSDEGRFDGSTAGRLQMIGHAWNMFVQNPLGNGPGAFEHKYGAYAHNASLDLLANLGIVGLLLWWSIYALLYFKAKSINSTRIRYVVYLSIVVAFLFELSDVFYTKRSGAVIMIMLWALCMINTVKDSNERSMRERSLAK